MQMIRSVVASEFRGAVVDQQVDDVYAFVKIRNLKELNDKKMEVEATEHSSKRIC